MNLGEFTPFLSIIAFLLGTVVVGDLVLKDGHKARLWQGILTVARLADRPTHLAFYCIIFALSLLSTLAIIAVSGLAEHQLLGAFKSLGPVLLPIALKIVILDYLLALKTHALIRSLLAGPPREPGEPPLTYGVIVASALVAFLDFALTAVITFMVFHWVEIFQAREVLPRIEASNAFPTLREFFDSVSLLGTAVIKHSFYALNGTALMWALLLIARMADGAVENLDGESIQRNICRIAGTILATAVAAVFFLRFALA